jgi:hypothetical protein
VKFDQRVKLNGDMEHGRQRFHDVSCDSAIWASEAVSGDFYARQKRRQRAGKQSRACRFVFLGIDYRISKHNAHCIRHSGANFPNIPLGEPIKRFCDYRAVSGYLIDQNILRHHDRAFQLGANAY